MSSLRRAVGRIRRGLGALRQRLRPSPADRAMRRIPIKGQNISYFPGFTVHHGAANIRLGSNICLTDALINAGDGAGQVVIEDEVFFGHGVQLLARGHDYRQFGMARQRAITEQPIVIRQGAWIASGSIILGGVEVGRHSVVAAGSVVTRDVPEFTVVGGNPACVIQSLEPPYASANE